MFSLGRMAGGQRSGPNSKQDYGPWQGSNESIGNTHELRTIVSHEVHKGLHGQLNSIVLLQSSLLLFGLRTPTSFHLAGSIDSVPLLDLLTRGSYTTLDRCRDTKQATNKQGGNRSNALKQSNSHDIPVLYQTFQILRTHHWEQLNTSANNYSTMRNPFQLELSSQVQTTIPPRVILSSWSCHCKCKQLFHHA
jgi:hypothetical protein